MLFICLIVSYVMVSSAYPTITLTDAQKTGIVANHNTVRTNWKVPLLGQNPPAAINGWSEALAAKAAQVAANCTFKHSSPEFRQYGKDVYGNPLAYGENLALASTSDLTKSFPIATLASHTNAWKTEESDWDCTKTMSYSPDGSSENGCKNGFKTPGNPYMCGHFTQIIWYKTFEIGCALANCPAGSPINPTVPQANQVQFFVCWYNVGGNIAGTHPLDLSGAGVDQWSPDGDWLGSKDTFSPCPNGNAPYVTTAAVTLKNGESLSAKVDDTLPSANGFFAVFVSATVICSLIVFVSLLVGIIAFAVFMRKRNTMNSNNNENIEPETKESVSNENDTKDVSLETQE